jgi:hypothetical protein
MRNENRFSVWKTAEELNMNRKTVRLALTKNLNMKKSVPKLYLESQQLTKNECR